ncbi:unnamed protein product [Hyaloperonospora brassicae]|uniref:Centromere protein J C-terminal domain-containing protein n=1 Tax=Hyaloperonospora brassicae TaxID=162125 RepID=A0AAV0TWL9_HYABA|nr:unnamed protein product [Hyaloperonospora brassicae]
MSMASARQSWEAKEQREAQEIAEFEAIERRLVEETAASQRDQQQLQLQQQLTLPPHAQKQVVNGYESEGTDWAESRVSLVADVGEVGHSRWQTTRPESWLSLSFDDSRDDRADPAAVFSGDSLLSVRGMRSQRKKSVDACEKHSESRKFHRDVSSKWSASSLDDAGPWHDGEALCELDNDVGLNQAETLQLQHQKECYDLEVTKLAAERGEVAQCKQHQRTLIEEEWEQERTKMNEEKLHQRQCKLRENTAAAQPNEKECAEVGMLEARIVNMQVDEKVRADKWKATTSKLQRRVSELEERNRELSDEVEFLKECHSEQEGDYDRRLKDTREASRLTTKSDVPSTFPSVLSMKNGLHEKNGFTCASEGNAQQWTSSDDNTCEDDMNNDCTAFSGCHHHNRVNGGERERSKLAVEDSHHSCVSMVLTGGMDCPSGTNFTSDANHARASHSATSEWVFTIVRNDDDQHEIGCTDRQCSAREKKGVTLAVTSPLELKVMVKEVGQRGGKRELSYADGSRTIMFPNGSKKDIDASGHFVIEFANGDRQEFFPDTGVSVYSYYEAQTTLTTYPDSRRVYEFANQQIETTLPDGTVEIQFTDGTTKTISANGDEFSVFPDGTTMLKQHDGLLEVTLQNAKTICFFPDGRIPADDTRSS